MGVAFAALLAALGGTAVALPGSSTVTSGDIKNNQVRTQDLRNSTIRGKDVAADTITGFDVNEGTLGAVPSAGNAARLGGAPPSAYLRTTAAPVGRSGFDAGCDPTSLTFEDCATASINLAQTSRLLVVGEAPFGVDSNDTALGSCRIELDGVAVPNTTARTGFQTAAATGGGDSANVGYGITTVTAPVAAGGHTVSISCNEADADIGHNDLTISVVSLSAG
jgi:hypothetical protein